MVYCEGLTKFLKDNMKHLKKFNESTESQKRLSVEDIEDYFLEFIDNGSMKFYYSGIPTMMSPNKVIETTFVISDKFRDVTTIEELTNFTNLINQIGDVVKRWNLDFKFSTIAPPPGPQQTQISIIQPVPKIIIDNFYTNNTLLNTTMNRVDLDGLIVRYTRSINVDDNSDFILHVDIQTHRGGSGQNEKWLKSDYNKFRQSESELIKYFTDNTDLPCEFIRKKAARDMRYGQPFYSYYYFKLLV